MEELQEFNPDELSQLHNYINMPLVIIGIISLILLIVVLLLSRKGSKKNKEISKKEMQYYIDNAFTWAEPKRTLSFNFSCNDGQHIRCSRGNKVVEFDIPIGRQTIICPAMVSEWFEGRNYNKREEDNLLEDLKFYLEENRFAKEVIIVEDDEFFTEDD